MARYHVALPDRSTLVLEAEEIARRLGRGELPLGCWYWRKGLGNWRHLSEVAELVELAAFVTAPPSSEPSTLMNIGEDDVVRAASSPFASHGWVEPADWREERQPAPGAAWNEPPSGDSAGPRTNSVVWQERGIELDQRQAAVEERPLRPSNIPPALPGDTVPPAKR